MKIKSIAIATVLVAAIAAVALASATATHAGPKPGLLPGKWQGTGVISGSVTDEVGTTTFKGKLGFRINVAKNLEAHGTGSWVKTMNGTSEFMKSTMTGIGRMWFGGFAHDIDYMYEEAVEGTIHDAFTNKSRPIKFVRGQDETLRGRLVITKARTCTAAGFIPVSKKSGVSCRG